METTQTHNYVLGDGVVVRSPDGKTRLTVDHSESITLARCATIYAAACTLSGRTYKRLSIRLSVYSVTPGNECGDGPETCYVDKHWDYDPHRNSMVIWDKGQPVYANDNGVICRDQDALYDTLC
jgi:hypothetical protein